MSSINVYTDGACKGNPGIGGWSGVIIRDNVIVMTLSGYEANTTNQRMEVTAAIKTLSMIPKTVSVTLYTDSTYLCNCINAKWYVSWMNNGWLNSAKKPVANADLWRQLFDELDGRSVKFAWVKGHASNTYNNMCDRLANEIIGYNKENISDE